MLVAIASLELGQLMSTASAGSFATYEDCILENMKGVESDAAALLIQRACRSKFPPPGHAPPCL